MQATMARRCRQKKACRQRRRAAIGAGICRRREAQRCRRQEALRLQVKKGHGCTAGASEMGLADADSERPANVDDEELAGAREESMLVQVTGACKYRRQEPVDAGDEFLQVLVKRVSANAGNERLTGAGKEGSRDEGKVKRGKGGACRCW